MTSLCRSAQRPCACMTLPGLFRSVCCMQKPIVVSQHGSTALDSDQILNILNATGTADRRGARAAPQGCQGREALGDMARARQGHWRRRRQDRRRPGGRPRRAGRGRAGAICAIRTTVPSGQLCFVSGREGLCCLIRSSTWPHACTCDTVNQQRQSGDDGRGSRPNMCGAVVYR